MTPSRANRLVVGMLAGNAVGAALVIVGFLVIASSPSALAVVGLPSLLFIPFCVGLSASWFWRTLNLGIGAMLLHSLLCTVLGLGVGALVFDEGAICLLILSPLLYGGICAGALSGRLWFRKQRDGLNLCLAPLLFIVVLAEPVLRSPHRGVVTDAIQIGAPPATVWPHVLAFDAILARPGYWLFRLGLPYPMRTTNNGNFVGADRSCEFSGGAVFQEKVAAIDPERLLTFDIIQMPPDPELIGHLDAHRGQFELHDNGDGTTTLVGRTWYSLHVRPAWYFDWWTHHIFRAVHLRVMRHIKNVAETEP